MNFSLGIDIGGTSVKAAAVVGGIGRLTERRTYSAPGAAVSLPTISEALRAACLPLISRYGPPATVGLCLPGLFDKQQRRITRSVNLPALVDAPVDALIAHALEMVPAPSIFTDAHAAAFDAWTLEASEAPEGSGRWFMISIGTGVGACVLDDGELLRVSGDSPGHFGQLDVSNPADAPPPIGPDGGRGSLEGYIGVPALCAGHGCAPGDAAAALSTDQPALRALARALRIAHAIYRPNHVRLLGGLGIRLAGARERLEALVNDQLTSVARQGWTLGFGSTDFHAATGSAKLASRIG